MKLRGQYKTLEGARKRAAFENGCAPGEFRRGETARLYHYRVVQEGAFWRVERYADRPRQAALPVFNPRAADEKTTAERAWSAPLKAPAPQKACDVGMFSDDHKQQELF